MRCVIFDLDGTLADTSGDLIAAANACFRDLGHGDLLDPHEDSFVAMCGARAMLRLGFDKLGAPNPDEVEAQFQRLIDYYARDIDIYTHLYPGAMDAVFELQSMGYTTGICTNKPFGLADTLLRRLGVRSAFASLIGADTLPVRKPDPAPFVASVKDADGDLCRSCLVGDTDTDLGTAARANVPSILVRFAADDSGVTMTPTVAITDYSQLIDAVEGLNL